MISTSIYEEITPTYLCIKQHSVTKLKYFCKTTRKDPIKYLGSGKYWKEHIKKHGKEFVETIWISDLYYDNYIKEIALHFSFENNIVESDDWANLIPEDGLGSLGKTGKRPPEFSKTMSAVRKGVKSSPQTCKIISESKTGIKNPNFGISRSEDCKTKIKLSNLGLKRSEKTKINISKANEKSYIVISPKNEEIKITNLKVFCKETNLNVSVMYQIAKGNRTTTHRGWFVRSI